MQITGKLKEKYFLEICLELSTSSKGLQKICDDGKAKDTHFPCRKTVFNWINQDPEFYRRYEAAKELQVESLVDEIIDIADDKSQDYVIDDRGNEVFNREAVQRSNTKIYARQWIVGKLKRKKYGDDKDAKIAQLEQKVIELLGTINGKSSSA